MTNLLLSRYKITNSIMHVMSWGYLKMNDCFRVAVFPVAVTLATKTSILDVCEDDDCKSLSLRWQRWLFLRTADISY